MEGIAVCKEGLFDFCVEEFLNYFKEFSKLDYWAIYGAGSASVALLRYESFGRMFDLAVGLYTAHRLALLYDLSEAYDENGMSDQSNTNIPSSISASTSQLSESSAPLTLATSDDPFTADLATTKYGIQLLALIRVWIPGGEIVKGAPMSVVTTL